ncbi:MAG: hypothetical protein ABIL39_10735 [candidate division WOR-3 bacterium]
MAECRLPTDLNLYENLDDPVDTGDIQLIGKSLTIVDCDTANWTIRGVRYLPFNSGGTYEPQVGDTLMGNTSGAYGILQYKHTISGEWASGDAAGKFYFITINGSFQNGETLRVGENNDVATAAGTDALTNISQALETVDYRQGKGSVKITIPPGIMALISKNFSELDISDYDFVKVMAKVSDSSSCAEERLWMGENYWNEQWDIVNFKSNWFDHTWNLANINANNRDDISWFAIQAYNSGSSSITLYIDFIRAAKKGQAKIVLPDGVFCIFPKIYLGSYIGTGTDNRTISLPRKGIPAAVFIQRAAGSTSNAAVWRHKNNSSGESFRIEGGSLLTDGIKSFGDGYFTIGTNTRVNNSGDWFHYIVFYED